MTFENLRNETKTKYIVGSLSHFVIVIGYGPNKEVIDKASVDICCG